MPRRHHLRIFWPRHHHWGPWPHYPPPPPFWGGWGWRQPTRDDEKADLDDYIEMLKDELAEAEAYRKELDASE